LPAGLPTGIGAITTVSELEEQFATLARDIEELGGLLAETGEHFWIHQLDRALPLVRERKLAGATFVLGCFGGADTLSDLVIGAPWEATDPLRFRNLNARLTRLRTRVFESANAIAARRAW
jgi:hypothetical protein